MVRPMSSPSFYTALPQAQDLEVWYDASSMRVQGKRGGGAILFHTVGTVPFASLLHPCCGKEWYVTEKGAGGCGSCDRSYRPSGPDWLAAVCGVVFASWPVLVQELLTAEVRAFQQRATDPTLTPLSLAEELEQALREVGHE